MSNSSSSTESMASYRQEIAEDFSLCSAQFKTYERVTYGISFILLVTAFYYLLFYVSNRRKHRAFPHNLPPMLLASLIIRFGGKAMGFVLGSRALDVLENNQWLCFINSYAKYIGYVMSYYIWAASFIILYFATVKRVPIHVLRSYGQRVTGVLGLICLVLSITTISVSDATYSSKSGQCALQIPALTKFFLYNAHSLLASLLFLVLGIPIVKVLTRSSDIKLLASSKVSMLYEEAVRQAALALIMFIAALLGAYRFGIQTLLLLPDADVSSPTLRGLVYPSCTSTAAWHGIYGTLVAIILILKRQHMTAVSYWIKSLSTKTSQNPTTVAPSPVPSLAKPVKKQQRPDLQSGVDENAETAVSVARPCFDMMYTDRVLQLVRFELELDGVRLNEEELHEMACDVSNTATRLPEGVNIESGSTTESERLALAKKKFYK